jgi:hypothetical protein
MKVRCGFRLFVCWLFGLAFAHAAVVIDASKVPAPPAPLSFDAGGRSPQGQVLAINSRYLLLDGKPWFPVMGEYQYSRSSPVDWERELLKMKAGGIQIVSTYLFWIHHEEIEGRFDWSGQRDLRRFVELADKHGMYVWVRVGPWDHGEVRNGGFPDWLLRKTAPRGNDPAYLNYVQRYYGEIGRQLKGLFWKDGGPIIGVQIENEYHERGPGQGEAHILKLKQMARQAGLEVPFYSVTAWDDAAVPNREVIPVFGGYPDGFWYRSLEPLPPSPNYFFTHIRCEENVGPDLCPLHPEIDARYASYPYLTAEMGGGMELSYHRRPLMSADDIAALDVVKLGSGVVLYGYYMFHGGTNPDGKATSLQESQLTGYPNDLPLKAYDFQAPLGEFGQMHPSFRDLKTFHLFLEDFGPALAPMASYLPERMPAGRLDRETPRVAARANGGRAFIFLNNYQKDHPLAEWKDFQVELKLPSGALTVPRQPLRIPSGAYTFWPVEMPVGGAVLQYATAQPLAKLDDPGTTVFFAWPGIPAEFVFHSADDLTIDAPHAHVVREGALVSISSIAPGPEPAIEIRSGSGDVHRIVLLSRHEARSLWKARIAGRDRLILSPAELYFDADRIHLESAIPASLTFSVYPHLEHNVAGFSRSGDPGMFESYAKNVEPVTVQPFVHQIAKPGQAPPVRMGPEVAMVPTEADFQAAARWSIRVPDVKSPAVSQLFLRITYQGDIARLYAGSDLVTDDFYHGAPWEIGLRNIPLQQGLELRILPLRDDAPVYLSEGARPSIPKGGQVVRLVNVQVVPRYEAIADLQPPGAL